MGVISIPALCALPSQFHSHSQYSSLSFSIPLYTNRILKSIHLLPPFLSLSMASSAFPVAASSIPGASDAGLELASSRTVTENDLLIVGPGVLGRLLASKWKEDFPGCQVYGQTITTNHHHELMELGISPCVKQSKPAFQFPFVVFCAPPYPSADYSGDIREAVSSWNGEGCFLFTSSSAPYDCNDNGLCDEIEADTEQLCSSPFCDFVPFLIDPDTPSVPIGRSSRTDVLLKAEKVALDNDGCALRLAGLYTADRGAHIYWLQKGVVEVRPDHVLNLIHYEDAASLAVTILKKKLRGRIFLGCDNHPLSRQEIMDLVDKSGKFQRKFEAFTGTSDPLGKRLNNSKTRKELGWEPKYPSFAHFLETL